MDESRHADRPRHVDEPQYVDDPRPADERRLSVSFRSGGVPCRGDLYLPDTGTEPPVVVMAHGFGGERTWRLPACATRFREHGIATLLFDYRTFGDSGGSLRNLISPAAHLADWRAAIDHVRSRTDVDGDRLALWGTSFSGGHVVATASRVPGVSAVVAQVPFTDGLATTAAIVRRNGLRYLLEGLTAALRDRYAATRGDAHYVPIVGDPDEFALLNTPEARAGVDAIVPEDATFRNECPARIVTESTRYRPITDASDVDAPVLVVEATRDSLVPAWTVDRLVHELDDVCRLRLPVGHFDVYLGRTFDRVLDRQTAFLESHLFG